jgi:hypothetical protein
MYSMKIDDWFYVLALVQFTCLVSVLVCTNSALHRIQVELVGMRSILSDLAYSAGTVAHTKRKSVVLQ